MMNAGNISAMHLGCLVSNVTFGADGKIYQRLQERFLRTNGMEWTVRRAKAIWNIALLSRNGAEDRDKMLEICRTNSISHRRSGIPKGIEGKLILRFQQAQRPVVLKRLAAGFRWYTSQVLPELSPAQREKAIKAISNPCTSSLSPERIHDIGYNSMCEVVPVREQVQGLVFDTDRKAEPIGHHLHPMSKYYSRHRVPHGEIKVKGRFYADTSEDIIKDIRSIPYTSMAMSFMTEPWVPSTLDAKTPCAGMRRSLTEYWEEEDNGQRYIGKISFLQEQGCKARVVAQPSAWLQTAFVPLHDYLAKAAERLFPRESCVTDQDNGAYTMMQFLGDGGTLYCTDLSSATDRFPLEYSLGVLDAMGLRSWSSALREVVSKPFQCLETEDGEIYYRTGQPMGLYSSFPLFHLSNNVLAKHAEVIAEKLVRDDPKLSSQHVCFRDGSCFRVLGDDIIISSPLVNRIYRKYLTEFGVQISEHKSFSGNVAEFAGFIGLRTNQGCTVFRPYKTPAGKGITNPIQFMDSIGSKGIKALGNKWWSHQFDVYRHTVGLRGPSLEPLVTVDHSVCGSTFRGDNQTLINTCVVLAAHSADPLPDISVSAYTDTVPLFPEQGILAYDQHGYDPVRLSAEPKTHVSPGYRAPRALSQDPLMVQAKQMLGIEEELVSKQRVQQKPKKIVTPSKAHKAPKVLKPKAKVPSKVHKTPKVQKLTDNPEVQDDLPKFQVRPSKVQSKPENPRVTSSTIQEKSHIADPKPGCTRRVIPDMSIFEQSKDDHDEYEYPF